MKTLSAAVLAAFCALPLFGQEITVEPGKVKYPEDSTTSINGIQAKGGTKFELAFKTNADIRLDSITFAWKEKSGLRVKDSKGNNLGKITEEGSSFFNKDDRNLVITYFAEKIPADASSFIHVTGKAEIRVLQDRKETQPVTFDVKEGAKFRIDGVAFEITKVDGSEIEFSIKGDKFGSEVEFIFTDAQDNIVKPGASSFSASGLFNKKVATKNVHFNKPYDKLTLVLEYWGKEDKKIHPRRHEA